jgi:YSIRK-targeted surface antigen transcriptional regulator
MENMSPDPIIPYEELLLTYEESVSYYCTPFHQFYGIVKHDEFTMIFGPIGPTEYTQQEKRNYAFTLGVSPLEFDSLLTAMKQIPTFTPENFLHLLLLLNFYFNGEKRDISEITPYLQITHNRTFTTRTGEVEIAADDDYHAPPHNTRSYEKEMLVFVREGDVNGLKQYLSSNIHGRVGILSHERIRQQKNIFIVATTLISRAAMDGGLYEDEAYELSDMYIRHCEELFSFEAILRLTYEMAMDYTQRVFSIDARTSLSPLVASVVTHIRRNISSDLSCATLAEHFSVHRNRLSAKFREDTGKTLSEFVMHEKIRRAKNLLAGTDKPFSEISYYLGFSSQSHFQTTFKRFVNQTPKEYRTLVNN